MASVLLQANSYLSTTAACQQGGAQDCAAPAPAQQATARTRDCANLSSQLSPNSPTSQFELCLAWNNLIEASSYLRVHPRFSRGIEASCIGIQCCCCTATILHRLRPAALTHTRHVLANITGKMHFSEAQIANLAVRKCWSPCSMTKESHFPA